jgi:hypothetical protein
MCWDAELQRKSRTILEGLDNCVAYRHFKFFENVLWNFDLPTPHPRYSQWTWESKKFEDLRCAELVNYILEPIKKCTDINFSS